MFQVGEMYSRKEIQESFGGEFLSCLPEVFGQVVCGCFSVGLNPDAPYEVQIGNAAILVKRAKLLTRQENKEIPIFIRPRKLKNTVKRWRYEGIFEVAELVIDPISIAEAAGKYRKFRHIPLLIRLKKVS